MNSRDLPQQQQTSTSGRKYEHGQVLEWPVNCRVCRSNKNVCQIKATTATTTFAKWQMISLPVNKIFALDSSGWLVGFSWLHSSPPSSGLDLIHLGDLGGDQKILRLSSFAVVVTFILNLFLGDKVGYRVSGTRRHEMLRNWI